jgi:hypothetical protein
MRKEKKSVSELICPGIPRTLPETTDIINVLMQQTGQGRREVFPVGSGSLVPCLYPNQTPW